MKDFYSVLHKLIDSALIEDVGDGDHSTLCCIPADVKGKAVLNIKQEGVLAGVQVAKKILQLKEPDSRITIFMKDGDPMEAGAVAFEVEALEHTILQCERMLLNCMQRMSGIATPVLRAANNFHKVIKASPQSKFCTIPP